MVNARLLRGLTLCHLEPDQERREREEREARQRQQSQQGGGQSLQGGQQKACEWVAHGQFRYILDGFAVIEEVAVTSGSAASGTGSIFGASRP